MDDGETPGEDMLAEKHGELTKREQKIAEVSYKIGRHTDGKIEVEEGGGDIKFKQKSETSVVKLVHDLFDKLAGRK